MIIGCILYCFVFTISFIVISILIKNKRETYGVLYVDLTDQDTYQYSFKLPTIDKILNKKFLTLTIESHISEEEESKWILLKNT